MWNIKEYVIKHSVGLEVLGIVGEDIEALQSVIMKRVSARVLESKLQHFRC